MPTTSLKRIRPDGVTNLLELHVEQLSGCSICVKKSTSHLLQALFELTCLSCVCNLPQMPPPDLECPSICLQPSDKYPSHIYTKKRWCTRGKERGISCQLASVFLTLHDLWSVRGGGHHVWCYSQTHLLLVAVAHLSICLHR